MDNKNITSHEDFKRELNNLFKSSYEEYQNLPYGQRDMHKRFAQKYSQMKREIYPKAETIIEALLLLGYKVELTVTPPVKEKV